MLARGRRVIGYRIQDPAQLIDAVVVAIDVAAEMGSDHDFNIGPMDDAELTATLTLWLDGADEVEASEVFGQRLIAAGVAFDDVQP